MRYNKISPNITNILKDLEQPLCDANRSKYYWECYNDFDDFLDCNMLSKSQEDWLDQFTYKCKKIFSLINNYKCHIKTIDYMQVYNFCDYFFFKIRGYRVNDEDWMPDMLAHYLKTRRYKAIYHLTIFIIAILTVAIQLPLIKFICPPEMDHLKQILVLYDYPFFIGVMLALYNFRKINDLATLIGNYIFFKLYVGRAMWFVKWYSYLLISKIKYYFHSCKDAE